MIDTETLAEFSLFVAKNIACNLDFIPSDKLTWKPAPEAKSVLEILNHVLQNYTRFKSHFDGSNRSAFTPATTADEAKKMLIEAAEGYAQIMRTATLEQWDRQIHVTGRSHLPLKQAATMLVLDTVNHHGQVTYIQTLLGDVESHFDTSAFQHISS
jgi:uncharacterized damage-inducible protein DinB